MVLVLVSILLAGVISDGLQSGSMLSNFVFAIVIAALVVGVVLLNRVESRLEVTLQPWLGFGAVALLGVWWVTAWSSNATATSEVFNWATLGLASIGLFIMATRGKSTTLSTLRLDLGLSSASFWADVLYGLVAAVALIAVSDLFPNAQADPVKHLPLLIQVTGVIRILFVAVLVLFTAAAYEEIFFRAVLLRGLQRVMGSEWGAIFMGAILFALYHVPYYYFAPGNSLQPHPTQGNFLGSVSLAIVEAGLPAVLYGVLYMRRGRLTPVIVMHTMLNALALAPYVKT